MNMVSPEQLSNSFALNVRIIKRQTEGLTHADSLLQPPSSGNCLNWVLGHIVLSQQRVLRLLGEEPAVADDVIGRYETGSDPVTDEADAALTLEDLLDALDRTQARVAAGLARITPEELAKEIQIGEHTTTVGQRLFGLYFHMTYHTGQTELLRQLAGTKDKVI